VSSSDSCIPGVAFKARGAGFAGNGAEVVGCRSGIEDGTFGLLDEVVVVRTCVAGVAVVENCKFQGSIPDFPCYYHERTKKL